MEDSMSSDSLDQADFRLGRGEQQNMLILAAGHVLSTPLIMTGVELEAQLITARTAIRLK